MRALKRELMSLKKNSVTVTTQAHEGIETPFFVQLFRCFFVTTQAHEGIETEIMGLR